jgi:hypothetical protein
VATCWTTAVVAAVVFWVAYDNGSYALQSRGELAVVLLWALIVGVAFGVVPVLAISRGSLLVGSCLAALATWTLASTLWAASAEDAFNEFDRVALYLAVFALVVVVSSRTSLDRWVDGLLVAVVAVVLVALISRLVPGSFPDRDLPAFLPSDVTRLSFPLGYWNGLGVFAGLALPLILRTALVARDVVVRGLVLAPVPAVAAAVYLTSSRGGVLAAVVGALVFVAFTERRWRACAALLVSGAGAAVAVAILAARGEVVDGPLGTDLARSEGRTAALLIFATCVATGIAYAVGCTLLEGRVSVPARVGPPLVLVLVVAAVAAFAVSHPLRRFDDFKRSPAELHFGPGDFVRAHLLSGSGSGRWQFWVAAIDEWKSHPAIGGGAGSFVHWWAEHASFTYFIRDAHSLYLEVLGELGVIGFALVLAFVLGGMAVGVVRVRRLSGDARTSAAALTAVWVAYAVAAGIDWMWELTAVTTLALVALGLICGSAATPQPSLRSVRLGEAARGSPTLGLGIGIVAISWLLLIAQAIPVLSWRGLTLSQEAAARGDLSIARSYALSARNIEPWAATPYLQLALVSEAAGDLRQARTWIRRAIDRDAQDWQLWLTAARIETKLGHIAAGGRDLRRAASLNPRSPLFTGLRLTS